MAVPWLRVLDVVLGLTKLARSGRARQPGSAAVYQARRHRASGWTEGRLAGVVAGAVKDLFDRDRGRLEFEREQRRLERQREERVLRLALLREAGEREIGRLRLVAGAAIASVIGTLVVAVRLGGGPVGARVALGCGCLLLLAAVAAAFTAQAALASSLSRADVDDVQPDDLVAGVVAGMAPWLVVVGLAIVSLAVLVAR